MEPLGFNAGLLFTQVLAVIVMIGPPVGSLVDLSKKRINSTPLAIRVLVICAVPVPGSLAYWMIRPTAETRI